MRQAAPTRNHTVSFMSPPAGDPVQEPVTFTCVGCGTTLSVPLNQPGISGPCPQCGNWITSPINRRALPVRKISLSSQEPDRFVRKRNRSHISADMIVDHQDLERRNSTKILKIITLAILVAFLCLAVTSLLKAWGLK